MITQQQQDQLDRSIVFSIADTGSDGTLPVASVRAGKFLSFDANGVPIVVDELTPGTTVSAAMIPVVTAPTTADALIALGLPGALLDLLIPSGTVWEYDAGGAAPTGFVFPIGQPCTPTYPDYRAKLVAAGSPYGTNGVDPLMPDRRSTVAAGKSNMGGVDNGLLTGGTVLGATLGVQNHNLLQSDLPVMTPIFTGTPAVVTVNSTVADVDRGAAGETTGGGGFAFDVPASTANTITSTGNFTPAGVISALNGGPQTAVSLVQPTFICNVILKVH